MVSVTRFQENLSACLALVNHYDKWVKSAGDRFGTVMYLPNAARKPIDASVVWIKGVTDLFTNSRATIVPPTTIITQHKTVMLDTSADGMILVESLGIQIYGTWFLYSNFMHTLLRDFRSSQKEAERNAMKGGNCFSQALG